MALSETDLVHLRRCVELAREALGEGHMPFGSLLVGADGTVLREERNEEGGGDHTRHPELALAVWASTHLTPGERAGATAYTTGEHCPMCAAAHGWVGLGRFVVAVRSEQLLERLAEWGEDDWPVAALPIEQVVPGAVVDGPAPELEAEMMALHRARHDRDLGGSPRG
jgi:tRNA(Arg) A34 adenosine deaminase TadA